MLLGEEAMGELRKRIISFFVVIMLFVALCATGVIVISRQSLYDNDNILTGTAGDNNPNSWDGSDKSGEVRFQLGADEDHVTMKYPTKIYLDKGETLENAGYYFEIVSGHFGGSASNRVYINPHIWGYRHDNVASPMDNLFSDYYYTALSEIAGTEVSSKTTSGVDSETGIGIGTMHGQLLLNVYKFTNDDSGYDVKIKLYGTPKNTGAFEFSFSSVSGMPVNNYIDTEQWSRWSGWTNSGSYTNMNPSPIRIEINIYDKDPLKNAINRLSNMNRTSESDTILSNAQSIFDNRKVTNAAVLEATRNVENEISRLENLSVELRNVYNDLNSKLTSIGVSSSTAGYKAIYDDLAVANNVINSSSPEISTINANISTLQYYLNIWDSHLSGGRYKIIKGTFGDSFATFIYPSKISMETGQSFADLGYEFIVDANYNPTNSDYRIFFDAGGWGNKANVISEYFTNYTYTATHSVGGDATAGNWSFQNYENQTSVNGNWRFASVTYNSKPYLLVSAGNQSYNSRINVTGTASKIGKFTYTHTMQSLAERWTSSTDWGNQYTISYSEPVSIDFEIVGAGVTEAKENLQTAKDNLIANLKNAAGKINNLDTIMALMDDIDAMIDSETATADEINELTQSVTNTSINVDRNWDANSTYCIEREIFVNQYVDADGNKYNYVTIKGVRYTGDANGKIKFTASANGTNIVVVYPDGSSSFTLKLNADHTGYMCEVAATCTICGVALEAREHNWIKGDLLHDATCVSGKEFEYVCSYDTTHTKTEFEGDINPNNHDWDEWTIVQAPTCTESGTKTRLCKRVGCGITEQGTIDALGHDFELVENISVATCTTQAKNKYQCKNDPRHIDERYEGELDTTNHAWGEWATENVATCINNGSEIRRCEREGCGEPETREIAALGHDHNVPQVTAPTCTEKGYTLYKCSRCEDVDQTRQNEIDALGHDHNVPQVTAPTCTEKGYTLYKCSRCENVDQTRQNEVEALGHLVNEWIIKNDATCTQNRIEQGICTREDCGKELEREIENSSLGHSYVETVVLPTCVAKGHTSYKCSVCNDEYTDNETAINPENHAWGEWAIENAATCTDDGSEIRRCEREGCGKPETRTIVALGHEHNVPQVTNPTCTEKGYTLYKCSRCEDVDQTKQNEVAALGHSDVDTIVLPTCVEKGYTIHKCSVCGNEERDNETAINPENHAWSDWTTENAATCTEDGSKTRTCEREGCGKPETETIKAIGHDFEFIENISVATCTTQAKNKYQCKNDPSHIDERYEGELDTDNHDWSEWSIENVATCTEDGSEIRTCKRDACGKPETKTIKAIGHDFELVENISVATCTTQAKNKYQCKNDPRHIDERYEGELDTTNHAWGEWATENVATCTEDGSEIRSCEREGCGKPETKTIAALGHDHNVPQVTNPTCTEKGYTLYKCSRCEDVDPTKQNEVAALGHSDVDTIVLPTCVEKGYTLHKCSVCGNEERDSETAINPNNHNWSEWQFNNNATCEKNGTETRTCLNNCGNENASETTEKENSKLPHNFVAIDQRDATCTESGHINKKCEDCNYEETEVIAPLGHDWDEGEITKQPTATEKGEKTHNCNRCDETKAEEIPSIGVMNESKQPEETEKASSVNIGAIVGGAVGGTAGLSVIIIVIFVIIKKKKI